MFPEKQKFDIYIYLKIILPQNTWIWKQGPAVVIEHQELKLAPDDLRVTQVRVLDR